MSHPFKGQLSVMQGCGWTDLGRLENVDYNKARIPFPRRERDVTGFPKGVKK